MLALVLLASLAGAQQESATQQEVKEAAPAAGAETGVAVGVKEVSTVQEVEDSVKQAAEVRLPCQQRVASLMTCRACGSHCLNNFHALKAGPGEG